MNGFDTGNVVPDSNAVVVDQSGYNAALAEYRKEAENLNNLIAKDKFDLEELDKKILARKLELDAQYAKTVGEVGDDIAKLKAEKESLLSGLDVLRNQIEDAKKELDFMYADVIKRENKVASDEDNIKKQAGEIAAAYVELDKKKVDMQYLLELHTNSTDEANRQNKADMKSIEQLQLDIQNERADIAVIRADQAIRFENLNNWQDKLDQTQKELDQKIIDNAGYFATAAESKKNAEEATAKLVQAEAQSKQNSEDYNQIQVLKIAVDSAKNEVNRREILVKQAEANITGGVQ